VLKSYVEYLQESISSLNWSLSQITNETPLTVLDKMSQAISKYFDKDYQEHPIQKAFNDIFALQSLFGNQRFSNLPNENMSKLKAAAEKLFQADTTKAFLDNMKQSAVTAFESPKAKDLTTELEQSLIQLDYKIQHLLLQEGELLLAAREIHTDEQDDRDSLLTLMQHDREQVPEREAERARLEAGLAQGDQSFAEGDVVIDPASLRPAIGKVVHGTTTHPVGPGTNRFAAIGNFAANMAKVAAVATVAFGVFTLATDTTSRQQAIGQLCNVTNLCL